MKRILLSLAISTAAISTALAQNEVKYEKLFYKNVTIENKDVTVQIVDAVSTDVETKFKLKIVNKTADFIVYKPEESTFIINGKEMKPEEKWMIISPNETGSKVINLKGAAYNALKNYAFNLSGLYKISANSNSIPTPDFKLPAANNDFKTGGYNVTLNKLYKETDATRLKFDIIYNGDKMGIVFPNKASVIMPNGSEHATTLSKSHPIILKKGESETVSLNWNRMEGGKEMDMQKANMLVKFNGMFTEPELEKIKAETLKLDFDEETSNAKRK